MAEEQVNPFEVQQPKAQPSWGGMPQLTPQGSGQQLGEGSSFQLSPEAMQMLWAPQTQVPIPQPQQLPAQTPQINPYA